MDKRKRTAYIYTAVTVLFLLVATFVVLANGLSYKVRNKPVYAVDISWDYMNSSRFSMENLTDYVDKTGVNTVVVPLYKNSDSVIEIDGMSCIFSDNDKDFLKQIKNKLGREKAQLYISVDCAVYSAQQTADVLSYITDEYKPVAIVLKNCGYSQQDIAQLKDAVGRKTKLILQAHGLSVEPSDLFDGYILENSDADQYTAFKNKHSDKEFILHFSSVSSVSDSYILTNFADFDGIIATEYTGEDTKDVYLDTVLKADNSIQLFGFEVSDKFTVTYPTADFTTYYSGVLVTGTGAQAPLIINDKEYSVQADGVFSAYITLEEGENILSISSKGTTYSYTVTKKSYGTSSVEYEAPWDETQYLSQGRVVQTTAQLTSMLSDPDDDSAIIAGLEPGTKLIVSESVETERSGYKTYAYRLSNGGYVLASKVEITDQITADYIPQEDEDISGYTLMDKPVLTGASLEKLKNGDEQLYIVSSANPAVISNFTDEKLSLLFLDAKAEQFSLPQSAFYTEFTITQTDAGVVVDLVLNKNNQLWGYDVMPEYGQTRIYLKQSPQLSTGTQPLKDITILLDAGHGGKDSGALGVASTNGPIEKELNLAVAKATKRILEKYGATVHMTREDDTFPSLDDRRNMTRDLKPDLFISLHHNSIDYSYNSTKSKGSECYYFTSQSENLATLMCENITAATGRVNRGAFSGYYYVTRTDIAPSVLMEYSMIINPVDYTNTYSDQDIYKAAFGTAMAVVRAIPNNYEV